LGKLMKKFYKQLAEERFQDLLQGKPILVARISKRNIFLEYFEESVVADYLILFEKEAEAGVRLLYKNEKALKLLVKMENWLKEVRNPYYVVPYLPELVTLLRNYLLLKSV